MMVLGAILGATVAALGLASRKSSAGPAPHGIRAACSVSIVLVAPRTAVGRIVDQSTGAHGFSHVALDACEFDDRGALAIDCTPQGGVQRRPLREIVGDADHVRLLLPFAAGREAYGCARAKLGTPYSALAFVAGDRRTRADGAVCSEVIADCLPDSLRTSITRTPGAPVSPNDIARAFNVPHRTARAP